MRLRSSRGSASFNIAITGEKYEDVWVDIYRGNETQPVPVYAQLDKTFIDTNEPYVHQVYSWNAWWPIGFYRLEVTFGDQTGVVGFEVTEAASNTIYVVCD